MSFLFGGGKEKPKDPFRAYEQEIRQGLRQTEREISRLNEQEKRLLKEIKAMKNIEDATSKARELVRLRAHRSKLAAIRTNMTGLAQELREIGSGQKTQEMLNKTTNMLRHINKMQSPVKAANMLREYEQQSSQMAMKQEIMDDTLGSAFEAENEAGLADEAVANILRETGFDIMLNLPNTGLGRAECGDRLAEKLMSLKIPP